jgi:hypothetical protein
MVENFHSLKKLNKLILIFDYFIGLKPFNDKGLAILGQIFSTLGLFMKQSSQTDR